MVPGSRSVLTSNFFNRDEYIPPLVLTICPDFIPFKFFTFLIPITYSTYELHRFTLLFHLICAVILFSYFTPFTFTQTYNGFFATAFP